MRRRSRERPAGPRLADPAVDDEASESGLFLLRSITPTGVEDLGLDFEPLPHAHGQPAAPGCLDSPAVKLFADLETSAEHVRASADARPSAIKRPKQARPTMNSLPLRIVAPICCATNRSATRQAARARGPAPPALARPDPRTWTRDSEAAATARTPRASSSAITLLLAKANEVVPTARALPRQSARRWSTGSMCTACTTERRSRQSFWHCKSLIVSHPHAFKHMRDRTISTCPGW